MADYTLSDPGADRIVFWDDSETTIDWLEISTGLTTSGTALLIDTTVVTTLTGTQTLTNKTLTAPVLGGTITGTYTLGGTITYDSQPALLAGRSGGQELIGGTGSGDDLTLTSTSNATKGVIDTADYVTFRGDGEVGAGWPLTVGGNYTTSGSGILAQRWLGYAPDGTNLHLFATGGGDDWHLANNAYYDESIPAWVQPKDTAGSTLTFMASGGEGINWYTAAGGDFPSPGWTNHMILQGETSTLILTNNDAIGTAASPTTGPSLLIHGDWGTGLSTTRPKQIKMISSTDANDSLEIGLDSNGVRDPFGVINVLTEGGSFHNLHLLPGGGNVGIGAFSDASQPAELLDIIGNIKNTGYIHMAEMSAPGNPAANTGYVYAADDGGTTTLYFKDSAGTATSLIASGSGLSDIVDDTTPQLGGMLDVNGNSLGDGTLELLSFSETVSAVNEFTIANAATGSAPVLSATGGDTNIGITLTPKGTGNITLGNIVLDSDQSIGAGQDNYVLTYDDGSGLISLEASTGGLSNIVEDTTPQLGAALDGQGFDLNNLGVVFLTEQAAAEADVAGKGQFWVKTATPNVAMFTDDAGTDFQLSGNFLDVTITSLGDNELIQYNSSGGEWENQTPDEMAASITTMANLVSVQGVTVTLADAGADAILGWDDTASAYENLSQAEVLAIIGSASGSAQGVVELATAAEIDTGTDSTRAIPVDQFVASDRNIRFVDIPVVEETTDVATGTTLRSWVCPFAGTIIQDDTSPYYFCAITYTAGSTGTMVVDVHLNGTTIMTTNKLDIETGETTTGTATTQPDLTTTAISAGDVITVDIDAIHTTPAKGLTVRIPIRMS